MKLDSANTKSLIVLLLLVLSSLIRPIAVDTASPGWVNGWSYRVKLTIQGQSGAGSNYIMRFYVLKEAGTSSGEFVYLNGKCEDNFIDVRFTASDGSTLLSFWREFYTSGLVGVFWVQITANLDANQSIFIYYGNPDATDASTTTHFLLFDHFESWDSSKWSDMYTETGTRVVANSRLKLAVTSGTGYRTVQSKDSYAIQTSVRFRLWDWFWRADRRYEVGYIDDPKQMPYPNAKTGNGTYFYQDASSQGYARNCLAGQYTGSAYDGLYDGDDFEFMRDQDRNEFHTHSFYLSYPAWDDDVHIVWNNETKPSMPLPITFSINAITGTLACNFDVDWVFVRPFVYPEPVPLSYSKEQGVPALFCWQLRLGLLFFGLGAIFLPIAFIGTQRPKAVTVIKLVVVIMIGFAMLMCAGSMECVD